MEQEHKYKLGMSPKQTAIPIRMCVLGPFWNLICTGCYLNKEQENLYQVGKYEII